MKTKITITVFLLICLCSTAWAQKKVINIKTSFDLDVRYLPSRVESVSFYVDYINLPESKQSNYTIKFKPKGDTRFVGKDTIILLNEPLDIEAMRQQLNKKLQIDGDSIRALSNNTIYDLAYILDTIPRPIAEQKIAGNLILNCYVKTFEKDSSNNDHQKRQIFVQKHTQELNIMKLKADSLVAKKLLLENVISKNSQGIVKIDLDIRQNVLKTDILNSDKKNQSSELLSVNSLITKYEAKSDSIKQSVAVKNITKANALDYLTTLQAGINTIQESKASNIEILQNELDKFVPILKKKDDAIKINIAIPDGDIPFGEKKQTVLNSILQTKKTIDSNLSKIQNDIEIAENEKAKTKNFLYDLEGRRNDIAVKEDKIKKELAYLDIEELRNRRKNIDSENVILNRDKIRNDSILIKANYAIKKKTDLLESMSIFQINKISIQIERGFVERIQVYVPTKDSDKYDIYENIYAIGFSSIKNLKNFPHTKLFSRLTEDYIYLSDVIANYDNLLENYTRDYSPADTTINHFKPKQGFIRLNREQFANLFDARIYTDLMGLSNGKPNGLIQVELARKFNILTSRGQIGKYRSDWGVLTYLNMFGSLSKIENNKKYLPLRNENIGNAGQLTSPYYATNLDFRLYQNLSLGAELNLFLFDYPDGKLTGYLDVGSTYGQTPLTYNKRKVTGSTVSQSERDSSLIAHSATIYPKLTLEIFSEKRVRLSMSYQFNTTRIYSNNNFKAIASYEKSDLLDRATEPYARRSHMLEVNLTASPTSSKHGRFFLRARYFIQNRDHNTFFSQIQFGYTYNLRLKKFE